MKRIFKYTLKIEDVQEIKIPQGAEFLTIQTQKNEPQLWFLVNSSEKETETWHLETVGTGHFVDYEEFIYKDYLGTYQVNRGQFVFHVFKFALNRYV